MQIRAGFKISYWCPAQTPMLLLLSVHPSRRSDLLLPDDMSADPQIPISYHEDLFGNRVGRIVSPAGQITLSSEFVVQDSGLPDEQDLGAGQTPIPLLSEDVLPFLVGSRYCETDQLSNMAWSLFGGLPAGWARVQAIVDYAHDKIQFGYEHARRTRTALEAHEEGRGVCRDFAHLAITLCRCMNIPARYCTGYLGDIGVPVMDAPMDFSAWFEAYLGGRWFTFDARHRKPRIGRILIARGRDAADVAISTAFGQADLVSFKVITEEVTERRVLGGLDAPAANGRVRASSEVSPLSAAG